MNKKKIYILLLIGLILMFVGTVKLPSTVLGAIMGIIGIVLYYLSVNYNLMKEAKQKSFIEGYMGWKRKAVQINKKPERKT